MTINEMSGCELERMVSSIGLDNIKLCTNNDELFSKYNDDELIDEIINNNDRDIRKIIESLFQSSITLDSGNDHLSSELTLLLNKVDLS